MKQINFKCKLLSDVVLKSSSATQGVSENLDYIPGAKFLGIAAKTLYNSENTEKTLAIFHNGNVQFGDAHICIKGVRTVKVPFSWFFKKGKGIGSEKYLHYKLTKQITQKLTEDGTQLKQARKGYFTSDKFINTDSNFSIKSAYDSSKRKAKDSQMYGYFALPKGSTWEFSVSLPEAYITDIVSSLEGRKRIGRSRSAEYGLVEISKIGESSLTSSKEIKASQVIIYAESNLCFYDEFGQNTLQPTVEQLGLPNDSIVLWDKSQVRTRNYQTWNSKRYNRDADRVIIEKGSVFIVETKQTINTSVFDSGIGAHKNEGFGKVLINPDFLESSSEKTELNLDEFKFDLTSDKYAFATGEKDEQLKKFFLGKRKEKERIMSVDKLVNKFKQDNISSFGGITPSQWGQVRNYAKHAANEKALYQLLFANETGYFMHGQSEHKWRAGNKRLVLEDYTFGKDAVVPEGSKIEFLQKLAAEMGKHVKSKKIENA